MTQRNNRSTAEKIALFRRCFTGLPHVYGTYDPHSGRACQRKGQVTDDVLLAHLTGKQPYGVYLLVEDKTRALAVDFDRDDISKPVAFVDAACSYGLTAYIERSKSKGYHVWLFFPDSGVSARKARLVAYQILTDIHTEGIEIFPKQDRLDSQNRYGNYINAPLFARLVAQGRTVFLDMDACATPHADQWEFLEKLQRIPETKLDEVIATFQIDSSAPPGERSPKNADTAIDSQTSRFGLPPCAQRMLADGVRANQRVACFRLAVNLKRTGLPYDLALATLKTWAAKNRPVNGSRIITDYEIESQSRNAYEKSYRALGCEEPPASDFCDPNCPIYQHRTANNKL